MTLTAFGYVTDPLYFAYGFMLTDAASPVTFPNGSKLAWDDGRQSAGKQAELFSYVDDKYIYSERLVGIDSWDENPQGYTPFDLVVSLEERHGLRAAVTYHYERLEMSDMFSIPSIHAIACRVTRRGDPDLIYGYEVTYHTLVDVNIINHLPNPANYTVEDEAGAFRLSLRQVDDGDWFAATYCKDADCRRAEAKTVDALLGDKMEPTGGMPELQYWRLKSLIEERP